MKVLILITSILIIILLVGILIVLRVITKRINMLDNDFDLNINLLLDNFDFLCDKLGHLPKKPEGVIRRSYYRDEILNQFEKVRKSFKQSDETN